MRVLMAIDGSKRSATILLGTCGILASTERRIDLMCVQPGHRQDKSGHGLRRATRILAAAKHLFVEQGFEVNTVAKTGSPARILIGASHDFDVVAVAAQSHRDVAMAGLGPVASRVAEHARTSVLIAREFTGGPGVRVLVAVDGSEGSLRALDKMVTLVDMEAADITLVHVVETPWLHEGPDQEWLGYEEDTEEAIDPQAQMERTFEEEGEQILDTARQRLPTRVTVSTMIQRGLPAEEILSEADRGGYDLMVIGSSGASDLKHQILGSVSAKIAWNARCSVLLVREEQ